MPDSSSYFARVASHWDNLRQTYLDESVIINALEQAMPSSEMTVVDLGTGTGFVAAALAQHARRVIGIDASAEMLKVARVNLQKKKVENVELMVGTAENLAIGNGSIEIVFGNMVLHHIPEPTASFAEIHRVLKKGGKVMLTDLDKHSYEWFRDAMADHWLGFDRKDIRKWMESAGFNNVRVDCADTDCCTKAPDSGPEVKVSVFYAYGEKS
ncbi:MAG: class I SAM-dependent methyltransferase [Bacteroidota bacterium]